MALVGQMIMQAGLASRSTPGFKPCSQTGIYSFFAEDAFLHHALLMRI